MVTQTDNGKILIEAKDISDVYRKLMYGNMSAIEAGNLIACSFGLEASVKGWTVKEITHILFIRAIQTKIDS